MPISRLDDTKLFPVFSDAIRRGYAKNVEVTLKRKASEKDLHDVWGNDELDVSTDEQGITTIKSVATNGKVMSIIVRLHQSDEMFMQTFFGRCASVKTRSHRTARGYAISWGTHSKDARENFSYVADVCERLGTFSLTGKLGKGSDFQTFSDQQVIAQLYGQSEFAELKRACAVAYLYPNNTMMMHGQYKIPAHLRYRRGVDCKA